ncbi:MAG: CHAT domain-containing protein [Flavobacteriales bacterium]|nr:CHAT domain-containing protein [Flavobacteriales bacterium]
MRIFVVIFLSLIAAVTSSQSIDKKLLEHYKNHEYEATFKYSDSLATKLLNEADTVAYIYHKLVKIANAMYAYNTGLIRKELDTLRTYTNIMPDTLNMAYKLYEATYQFSAMNIDSTEKMIAEVYDLPKPVRYQSGFELLRANCLEKSGNSNEALSFMRKAMYPEMDPRAKVSVLHNIANCHKDMGNPDSSLYYFNKSLDAFDEYYYKPNIFKAVLYANIGLIYKTKSDYQKALEYVLTAYNLLKEYDNITYSVTCVINLASIEAKLQNYEKAIEYNLGAIPLIEKHLGPSLPLIFAYRNLGRDLTQLHQADSAIKVLKFALNLFEVYNIKHPLMESEINSLIAKAYFREKASFNNAKSYWLKSLKTYEDQPQFQQTPYYAERLKEIGELYLENNKIDASISYFKKYIQQIFNETRDPLEHIPDKSHFAAPNAESVRHISLFAQALYKKGLEEKKYLSLSKRYLELSLDVCYEEFDPKNSDQLNHFLIQEASNLIRLKIDLFGYEYSSEELYEETQKRKSIMLSYHLSKTVTDLQELPLNLSQEIQYLTESLDSLKELQKNQGGTADSTTSANLEKQVGSFTLLLEQKQNQIIKDFPLFNKLNPNTLYVRNKSLQNLLQNNKLIEFSITDSSVYIFLIDQKNFTAKHIPNDSNFNALVSNYLFFFDVKNIQNPDWQNHKKYQDAAYRLFKTLIGETLLPTDSSKLIFVTDGILNFVPFESLVHQKIEQPKNFASLNYLVKSHVIKYAYAARLIDSNSPNKGERKESGKYIGFAPSYDETAANDALIAIRSLRDDFAPLKYNQQEIEMSQSILGGTSKLGNQANERVLRSNLSKYSIIHLATHTFLDDENPLNSKIVLSNTSDSVYDDLLHTYEVYNMNLPTELLILSSCESGSGIIKEGEGVMSLSRAFGYAGCRSIIMNLWKAHDKSSSKLIPKLLRNLKQGMHKDKALQKAKIEYLYEYEEDGLDHPFYWGHLVIQGDTSPIPIQRNSYWYLLLIIPLLLIIFLALKR